MLQDSRAMLRDPLEAESLINERQPGRAMDPILGRRGRAYGKFIEQLFNAGIIEQGNVLEEAGLFFVKKKNGDLRLIFDTRRPNCWYKDPSSVALFSGESLSSLEVSSTDHIHLRTGDVECCFYQYALPEHHRVYFGIPLIKAMHLPATLRGLFSGAR